MKTKILFFMALVVASTSEARYRYTASDRERDTQRATNQATGMANSAQSGNGTTSTNYQTLEQSSKDTMQNSQKGQTTATIMKVGMYATGAVFASSCGPQNIGACVMAAVMFYMGGQAGRSANSFQSPINTAWQNTCSYSTQGCNSQTPDNPYDAAMTPGAITTAKQNQDKITTALKREGYEVDLSTGKIKTPNGEVDASSQAGLESALGADGLNKLNGEVGAIQKDARAKVDQIKTAQYLAALGLDGGGGGSNIGSVAEGYADGTGGGAGGGLASKLDKLRKPAAKGLTKNFNGDPIGVASDSIFEMMSRRYQLKNTQKTFYGAEIQ